MGQHNIVEQMVVESIRPRIVQLTEGVRPNRDHPSVCSENSMDFFEEGFYVEPMNSRGNGHQIHGVVRQEGQIFGRLTSILDVLARNSLTDLIRTDIDADHAIADAKEKKKNNARRCRILRAQGHSRLSTPASDIQG